MTNLQEKQSPYFQNQHITELFELQMVLNKPILVYFWLLNHNQHSWASIVKCKLHCQH